MRSEKSHSFVPINQKNYFLNLFIMKKTLLSIGAALLFGFGAMAQDGTLTATSMTMTNAYQAAGAAQAKGAFSLFGISSVELGQAFKITVTATSDTDLSELEAAIVDTDPNAGGVTGSYWDEISEFGTFSDGGVEAGVEFTKTVTVIVKSNYAFADALSRARLAINGKNSSFPKNTTATATATVEFTGVTIAVVPQTAVPGTQMPLNADNKNQVGKLTGYMPATFAEGDKFTITVSGKPTANVTEFQIAVVDERAEVSYFDQLSEFTTLEGEATSGQNFSVSAVVEITKTKAASTDPLASTLVLTAVSSPTVEILGIENLEITVTPYEGGTDPTDPTDPDQPTAIDGVESAKVSVKSSAIEVSSEKAIASVVVTNVAGVQVVNQAVGATSATVSTADLQAGVYYAVINFANGSVQVVKFVK